MYTKQEIIIRHHREGRSQRSISRELGISRNTVKRYITEYEELKSQGKSSKKAISEYLVKTPKYKTGKRGCRRLTPKVQEAIDKYLEKNAEKRHEGLGKQQMKKCDIHEQLLVQGYDIGYTTVCNYIRNKTVPKVKKEAFIRQQYQPGESCEFDWGEVKIKVRGELIRLQLAVFTSAYSNYRYAALYHRQDTLSFMESHIGFYSFTGGAYQEMVYDNMRVAVAKFVGKHEKEPTQALLQLRGHYSFRHRFCNIYSGNEKGHVERSVEYVRRKAFGIKDEFNSVEEAEQMLLATINQLNGKKQQQSGETAKALLEKEKAALYPAPTRMLCAERIQLRVDKYATVSYKTNRYSVPDNMVGDFVDVKITSKSIAVYKGEDLKATHTRHYQSHQWVIDINHYLSTFEQKPGALARSVALAGSGYLKQIHDKYFKTRPRAFIDLLSFCQKEEKSNQQIGEAITRLQHSGVKEVTVEQLKALLGNKKEQGQPSVPDKTDKLARTQLQQQTALMNF